MEAQFRSLIVTLSASMTVLAGTPLVARERTNEENLERCAEFMAAIRRPQDEIKGLKIYSHTFNCQRGWERLPRSYGAHWRGETIWYSLRFSRHKRFQSDDRLTYEIGVRKWEFPGKPPRCEFAIYNKANIRIEDRIGRPFERYVTEGGWQLGLRRSLRREKYRQHTWRDIANWIAVAATQRLVPKHCKVAALDWRSRGYHESVDHN